MTTLALGLILSFAQPAAEDARLRIGRVIPIGNTATQQSVILDVIRLNPGQRLDEADLASAEARLARLRIFKSVSICHVANPNDPKSRFRDVLVNVEETCTDHWRVLPGWSQRGEAIVSLVWEERNFDPWRWPTSPEDWRANGAFRGGGMSFRLEVLQVPLLSHGAIRLLPRGSALLPAPSW